MSSGSYDPSTITPGGLDEECRRLETQAELTWTDEAEVYATLGLREADVLLEIGSGPGAITARLDEWRGGRGRLVALDYDQRLLARNDAHRRVAGDAGHLPLRNGCADAALVRYVLQHVPDPARMLAEARRVVRPGGRVVIVDVDAALWGMAEPYVPGFDGAYRALMAAQRNQGGDRLIARKLPRLLAKAGFEQVAVRPFATTSDGRGVDAFEVHLGPQRILPLVASGELTMRDLGLATAGWQQFRTDPESWVMLLGLAVTAVVPG